MKIIADDKIPFLKGVLEPFCDIDYLPGNKIQNSDLVDVDGLIIRTRTHCNEELLAGTKVKFIATATIGFDHIDESYCAKQNIKWTNAPGCNSGSVQQWFMASLLFYAQQNKIDLTTRSLGIIGVGNVGSKILDFAENLGMRVLLNDPPKSDLEGLCGFISLESILRESDIITCHVPLSYENPYSTFHLANEVFFKKIMNGSIFVNSSRGEVVDTGALNETIDSGKFEGVILDVWENEPQIDLNLLNKVEIATPHIAGYSVDGKANGTAMSVNALSKVFNMPLDDWYPDDIPTANDKMSIEIDAKKKSYQAVLTEAILGTYDILSDDKSLRSYPSKFENLRGSYPIRREPKAWQIKLQNDHRNFNQRLENLGFSVMG